MPREAELFPFFVALAGETGMIEIDIQRFIVKKKWFANYTIGI